jgi:NPCBM/NEW2 domain
MVGESNRRRPEIDLRARVWPREGPTSAERAGPAQRCVTIGSQAGRRVVVRSRWVTVTLTLVLSGTLVACSSGIHHSPGIPAAVQATSAPATAQSTSAPATTGSAVASVTPTPSGGPGLATSIQDLQTATDSEPYDTQGVAQVNGVTYPNSLGAQFCFGSNERKWTYVLGRKYASLQGTIGLSDNSVSDAKILFQVLSDGRLVYAKSLQVGQSATLNVPVSNVLQLELDTTLLSQDGGCGGATGEWADVQVAGP